jgi:hypothetical protein
MESGLFDCRYIMIITFKSQATADTIMFGDVAKDLLSLMGKSFEPRGIITLEQLPDAIAALRKAADDSRAAQRGQPDPDEALAEHPAATIPVSLAQRAVPLIEQLERSLRASQPVIWES